MAFLKPCEDNGHISKEPKRPDQFEALHPYLASVNKATFLRFGRRCVARASEDTQVCNEMGQNSQNSVIL